MTDPSSARVSNIRGTPTVGRSCVGGFADAVCCAVVLVFCKKVRMVNPPSFLDGGRLVHRADYYRYSYQRLYLTQILRLGVVTARTRSKQEEDGRRARETSADRAGV